jgi:hypothetical protein
MASRFANTVSATSVGCSTQSRHSGALRRRLAQLLQSTTQRLRLVRNRTDVGWRPDATPKQKKKLS